MEGDPASLVEWQRGYWLFPFCPWVPLSIAGSISKTQTRELSFLLHPFKIIYLAVVLLGFGTAQDDLHLLKLGSFYFKPDLALSHAALLGRAVNFQRQPGSQRAGCGHREK